MFLPHHGTAYSFDKIFGSRLLGVSRNFGLLKKENREDPGPGFYPEFRRSGANSR